MALKKSLLVAGAVTTIGLASSMAGVHAVSAETTAGGGLVDKIAQKFNLSKDEVQKVVDEHHQEGRAEHTKKLSEKLDQAVADGKLTEDQKTKILAKLEEMEKSKPSHEDMANKTKEQPRAEIEQEHAELKQWAADNNIPEEYMPFKVHLKRGPGGPDGPRGDKALFQMRAD